MPPRSPNEKPSLHCIWTNPKKVDCRPSLLLPLVNRPMEGLGRPWPEKLAGAGRKTSNLPETPKKAGNPCFTGKPLIGAPTSLFWTPKPPKEMLHRLRSPLATSHCLPQTVRKEVHLRPQEKQTAVPPLDLCSRLYGVQSSYQKHIDLSRGQCYLQMMM